MMDIYKNLALKYRPNSFKNLVGQEHISKTLSLALDTNRLSHAYLFSGLRGSGKTSTARIMAKSIICEKGVSSTPCGVCDNCISASKNSHLDIIEMDAASNRGIDDIKDLIEHTKYQPNIAKYKIFIIDEVHMLTTQAFNALLKTLEEPPPFVKFILATTDALKLPATILSRTQHFRFNKISSKDIVNHLEYILNQENIKWQQNSLEMISRRGEGSLRDTLTILDQLIVFSKSNITLDSITDMLGLVSPELMDKIFDSIFKEDDILSILDDLEDYEIDLVLDEMSIYLKDKMIAKDPKFDILIFDRFFRIISDGKYLLSLNSNSDFVLILTLNKLTQAVKISTKDNNHTNIESNNSINKEKIENINTNITKPVQSSNSDNQTINESNNISNTSSANSNDTKHINNTVNNKSKDIKDIKKEDITLDPNIKLYKDVIAKVYDRSYELGSCFEKNFIYQDFKDNKLFIISYALDDDRKLLYKNFALLRGFIEDFFGEGVDIQFQKAQKKKSDINITDNKSNITQEDSINNKNVDKSTKNTIIEQSINEIDYTKNDQELSSSKEEESHNTNIEKKSINSNKIDDMSIDEVLNSPMLNKTKELFDVKKITVQQI
jgi:DNA polymerase III subunit gamma/tau